MVGEKNQMFVSALGAAVFNCFNLLGNRLQLRHGLPVLCIVMKVFNSLISGAEADEHRFSEQSSLFKCFMD